MYLIPIATKPGTFVWHVPDTHPWELGCILKRPIKKNRSNKLQVMRKSKLFVATWHLQKNLYSTFQEPQQNPQKPTSWWVCDSSKWSKTEGGYIRRSTWLPPHSVRNQRGGEVDDGRVQHLQEANPRKKPPTNPLDTTMFLFKKSVACSKIKILKSSLTNKFKIYIS